MLNGKGDVLYVGKARSLKKRVAAYAKPAALPYRIARMISETAEMIFISTASETEALLLEANLIKRLKPRYNVAVARRQELSEHPAAHRSSLPAGVEASRRERQRWHLFRAVSPRRPQ